MIPNEEPDYNEEWEEGFTLLEFIMMLIMSGVLFGLIYWANQLMKTI